MFLKMGFVRPLWMYFNMTNIGLFLILVVADVGGLLGFFLGCSILSIIEIGYFIIEALSRKIKEFSIGKTKKRNIM